jgi:sugar-specific transcriptional regulator TrmB
VNDLSKTSRVPRAKLYEVLESLNRKGLIDVLPETPQRFRANPVSALYDTRVEELRAEEAELKRAIGDLMVSLGPSTRPPRREGDREFVHIAHGRTHFPILARQLVAEAKSGLAVVGDRLFLARLRFYEDLVEALARAAKSMPVRILVPNQVLEEMDGRRLRLDEIEDLVRRAPWPQGEATVWVRDQAEYLAVRFQPNDLHPSRGSDRVEVGQDAEIAGLWHRLVHVAWEQATPWSGARR